MKKYTLYKASKISKISRYKLEQAIEEGLLQTQEGKGTVKYLISEADLKVFLKEHGDQFVQVKYNEEAESYGSQSYPFVARETHEKILFEKERTVQNLETQVQKLELQVQQAEKSSQVLEILRDIANELPSSKTKESILNRLSSLR